MTTGTSRQLVLDLPHRVGSGPEDFLVTASNERAAAMIESWPGWPSHAAILLGPAGSGKSHLVEIWRQASGGRVLRAAELSNKDALDLPSGGAVAVEDLPGPALDEAALFHLLNMARENRGYVLMTTRQPLPVWAVSLPDLASRLKAVPVAEIASPDDALLRGLVVKLFADRQIGIGEPAVAYMLSRMPRSFAAARDLVAEIDRLALAEKAEVTRAFVARAMTAMGVREEDVQDTDFRTDGW